MTPEMIDRILSHPELRDRDVRIVMFSIRQQEEGVALNQELIAKFIGSSSSTVERCIRRLRELRLLSTDRVDSHVWYYDFSAIYNSHLTVLTPHSSDPSELCRGGNGLEDEDDDLIEVLPPQNEVFGAENKILAPQSSDPSPHIYNKQNTPLLFSDNLLGQEGKKPMKIVGPDSRLKNLLSSIPEKNRKHKQKREEAARSKEPTTGVTPVAQYNCNDMYKAYCSHWRKSGLLGNPQAATAKDRKLLKDMIAEQGAVEILRYIKWVFKNWEGLRVRDGVHGAPSVGVLFGFRNSWFYESLEGKKVSSRKSSPSTAEYNSDRGDDDSYSESWG